MANRTFEAGKLHQGAVSRETGRVVGRVGEQRWQVATDDGLYRARRATSCLLLPEVDDLVSLVTLSQGTCFIVTIVDRSHSGASTLSVDGDLEVAVEGDLAVVAQRGIELVTAQTLDVVTGALEVTADRGRAVVASLRYLGELVQTEVGESKTVARTLDMVLDRFSQRTKRSYRTVEGIDQVRAGHVDVAVNGTMHLRGEHTVVSARDVVKMDGRQVQIG